mmetsp:Transcript_11461/g.39247  ORF Transcript_11461/g.39247 Transcript_11461/m.39247 type:complete len:235 (-) Transcript_11461:3258-3962(-)
MCVCACWIADTSLGSSYLSSGFIASSCSHFRCLCCRRILRISCFDTPFSSSSSAVRSRTSCSSAPPAVACPVSVATPSAPSFPSARLSFLSSWLISWWTAAMLSFCSCVSFGVRKLWTAYGERRACRTMCSTATLSMKAFLSFSRALLFFSLSHASSFLASSTFSAASFSRMILSSGSTSNSSLSSRSPGGRASFACTSCSNSSRICRMVSRTRSFFFSASAFLLSSSAWIFSC